MLVGSVMTVKTFDVLDLVNMVAAQHEWDLWFDSGSGDDREVIFAKKGKVTKEITVEFDFTGRIERSEYRRNGKWFERHHVTTDVTTASRSHCHAKSVQAVTARPVHWSRWHDVGSAEFHMPLALWPASRFAQLWPRPHRAAPSSWLIPANHQSIS